MLVGVDGGSREKRKYASVGEALRAYLDTRIRELDDLERAGVELVLEIVAAFFQRENADLIPGAGRHAREQEDDDSLLAVLDASFLVKGLTCCVYLFPHYCVVSAALIALFQEEVRLLVGWCSGEGFLEEEDARRFERYVSEAGGALKEHQWLQETLEGAWIGGGGLLATEGVQGRFKISRVERGRVEVKVPKSRHSYSVCLPAEITSLFRRNQEVSLVLEKYALGWHALAASLPISTKGLERKQMKVKQIGCPPRLKPVRS